jgi:hypothetical protein
MSGKEMLSRYPVLLLCTLSVTGVAASVALLFNYRWLAILIYGFTAIGFVPLIAWMVRRDTGEE